MFCDGDCTYAMCGDGYHNMLSEECDDGNAANNDGCIGACVLNECGDGVVWEASRAATTATSMTPMTA
jgi:cysteine-rich repeat protein